MGRNYIYTNSSNLGIGTKKRTFGRKFSIGPKAIRFVAVIIFSAMAMIYLTQTTNGAGQSMQMRELSNEKSQLTEQVDRLKIEESRLESLNQINQSISAQQSISPAPATTVTGQETLVPTTTINHIPVAK